MSNWGILEANPLEQKNTGGRFPGPGLGEKPGESAAPGKNTQADSF